MSHAISNAKTVASSTTPDQNKENSQLITTSIPSYSASISNKQDALRKKSEEIHFSLGMDSVFQECDTGLRPSVFEQSKEKNVFVFHNCSEFTVNTAEHKPKRIRRIIDSDDSDN